MPVGSSSSACAMATWLRNVTLMIACWMPATTRAQPYVVISELANRQALRQEMEAALRKMKQPLVASPRLAEAAACHGDETCLAQLGSNVGAKRIILLEEAGLADATIIYVRLITVQHAQVERQITFDPQNSAQGGPLGAMTELLTPTAFVGRLALRCNVDGAVVYVDGSRLGVTPWAGGELPVGTHALRVTHPEHRDGVQFIDIRFGQATETAITLREIGAVDAAVVGTRWDPAVRPWYRHWGVLVAGAAVLGGVAAYFAYDMAHEFEPDHTIIVTP